MEQVFTTNWVLRQSSAPVQMGLSRRQLQEAHALVYSLGNLTLLGPRYWMPSVYLIQYSVSSTETAGKSFLPLRRKRNGASVRERSWPRWCKVPSASWPLRIHHLFSSMLPLVLPFISLATPVRFRDTAASETQQRQEFNSYFKFCT